MNKPSVPALAETEKGVNQVSKKERAAGSSSLGIFAVAAHGNDQSERNTPIGALDINGFAQDRLKLPPRCCAGHRANQEVRQKR